MQQYADLSSLPLPPVHPGLEALEDGFFMTDPGWRITYWNAAAERLLGLARGRVMGRDLWTTLPFLLDASTERALRGAMNQGTARRVIQPIPHRPGQFSLHAAPVQGGGMAVHFRDASEEVTRTQQSYALLEAIRDGFVAVDAEWRIVYLNAAAESVLRLRRDIAIGVPVWGFLTEGPDALTDCLRSTMTDRVRRHLSRVQGQGRVAEDRVYDLWTYPVTDGGIAIVFKDVTEHVEREATLASLASEAEAANQGKSRFFTAVSHELRTPLNAIVGYTHLLASGTYGDLPPPAHRAADRASLCAEHLASLVEDLLVLTSNELHRIDLTIVPIELGGYLDVVVKPYRMQAEAKGLSFELELPDEETLIETDTGRFRQLLDAILGNAVRYTMRGAVGVALRKVGAEVEIAVHDTGPGVSPADRERIFGPFEKSGEVARSNPLEQGCGLGLTVARELATLLKGTLSLRASSPEGSCFCVRLPLDHR